MAGPQKLLLLTLAFITIPFVNILQDFLFFRSCTLTGLLSLQRLQRPPVFLLLVIPICSFFLGNIKPYLFILALLRRNKFRLQIIANSQILLLFLFALQAKIFH